MRLLSLVKPGIIFGNLVTFCGGYFLSSSPFQARIFLLSIAGMALIIACGCVLNNHIDRDIDRLMTRTKNRPCAQGLVSGPFALSYAFVLGLCGLFLIKISCTNITLAIACLGLFVYVVIYSLWLKRHSVWGTFIGGISGAVPPVVGYSAATGGHLGSAAIILFAILLLWQIPHSYAIGIYRIKDYQAAKIPVLPTQNGILTTQVVMLVFVIAYAVISPLLYFYHHAQLGYLVTSIVLGLIWLIYSLKGFRSPNTNLWARKMFAISIFNITFLCLAMAIF